MNKLRSQDDYQTYFDTDWYQSYYFTKVEGFLEYYLKTLHEIFSSGQQFTGTRLVDIGSGPCISGVLSASSIYSEIFLSDLTDKNRQALENWWKATPGYHDWTAVLKCVAQQEGISIQTLEDRTRKTVQGILPCDVLAESVLPASYSQFDCVVSSACLEGVCADMTSYKASVRKLGSLLKPGGTFVLFTYLGNEWYRAGDAIFAGLNLTKEDIKQSFTEAGFVNLQFTNEQTRTAEEKLLFKDYFCSDGYVFVTGNMSGKNE